MRRKENIISNNNAVAVPDFDIESFVSEVDAQKRAKLNETSRQEQLKAAALHTLGVLGGLTVEDDSLDFEGDRFILPAMYAGRVNEAVKFLKDWQQQQSEPHAVHRTFNYRPYDVAAAFERTLRAVFGTSGYGVAKMTFFGPQPPAFITVPISTTESIQVPWGSVRLPPLEAQFEVGYQNHPEHGVVGHVAALLPRKFRQHVEGFFAKMEEELRRHSIYKGKAIDGAQHPNFISTEVDPKRVVYSDSVIEEIETHLWLPLRHPGALKAAGLPIKRQVLIEGPFGTGKTLLGLLTAQEAIRAGYTFIQVRPGTDGLFEALKTARLYAPAVLWFEDLDTKQAGDVDHISKLLDALDGMSAKADGGEVIAVFTTNYVELIQKGVMRPGRLDAVIHIGDLDATGFERLCRAHIPDHLQGEIDYVQVAEAFAGFPPAFNVETIGRALRYMLNRTKGVEEKISTEDLVNAAKGMRHQLKLMHGAGEGAREVSFGDVLDKQLRGTVTSLRLDMSDGEIFDPNRNNE